MAESTVSTSTDTVVITTLLVRLTQNSRSGRLITPMRLSSVGGTGSPIGSVLILGPSLNTLTSTTYSGTKNNAPTTNAPTGRTHPRLSTPTPPIHNLPQVDLQPRSR